MGGRALRVLYAEDDALLSEVIAESLMDLGYDVSLANDGQHALEIAAAADAPFDILVTDLHMPRLDGMALIGRLRADRPGLPIVVLSGNPPASGHAAFDRMGHGPLTLLQKPSRFPQIVAAIEAVLARSPAAPA
jgi:two-component system response regulator HydG